MNKNRNEILVTRSSMPPLQEYIDEISSIWDSHWLTNMGEKHNTLARQLKEYLNAENIDLLVNGHMALELSIQAMKLTGEVITTPFTFASTTHAIVRNGLKPVFGDIEPETYTMDVSKIESLITDRTTAIIPVHVYGNVCNVEEIERIAKKYGLVVIYDSCHAFGVDYKGKSISSYGDINCFSFHATKVFNTIEGGAVTYRNGMDDFGEALYNLKNFGIRGPERVEAVGANAKMNEFAAAMGICNLRHVDEEISKRSRVYYRYLERLDNVQGIQLNKLDDNVTRKNYAYFPIVFKDEFGASRNEVFEALAQNGINARKYFYPITNSFECYRNNYDTYNTPVALHISKRVLTLPMYADLSLEDVDSICNIILSCKK
jgi:dTDP-4-amino-4,6-dideoxygalactose transaminase